MRRSRRLRLSLVVAAVLVLHATIVWYAWRTTSRRAMRDAEIGGRQRLALYASSIERSLDKYRPLPEILARDKDILALLHSPHAAPLVDSVNRSLEATNAATNASALIVLGTDGVALAASNWNLELSTVGRPLAYRPYYQRAIATGIGRFFGVGTTSGLPGYYMASAVQSGNQRIGVVVVKVDLEPLERDWTRAEERVLVEDANGVAFLASRPELKYGLMAPLPPDTAWTIAAQHQYPVDALHAINYSVERELAKDASIVRLHTGGRSTRYLMQSLAMPSDSWTIHYLSDLAAVDAQARDGALKAAVALVAATLLLLYVRQRRLALRATLDSRDQLEAQVHARTADLRAEITERQKAENILRAAQDELVHAGKMAALGQMSAAIAHELNQPLTAMQTFLASTRVLLEEGDEEQVSENLVLLEELGQRMSRITGQLRGFSPRRSGRSERVALGLAIERALLLCEGRVRLERVEVDMQVPPGASVLAERTRIEQIVLNLVRNALDAMTKREERHLSIHVTENGERCTMRVGDTGEGIREEHLARVFEPFFTTKEDSEGLGLGLSVTYGIVRELGGSIRVESALGIGTTFIVELPRYEP